MSLNEEQRCDLVDLYWEKAMLTKQEMQVAIDCQSWSMAANRMYYACFHAVTALLVADGHPVSTHLGAKITFGKYYVKIGLASPEDGRLYSQLESLREKSDYDILFRATEEDVAPMLPRVTSFLDTIHNLLIRNKS